MRFKLLALAAPLLVLAACEMKIGKDEDKGGNGASVSVGEDGNVQVSAADGAKGVSIDVPGFSAKVNVPGLQLGSDNMDIDGIKLYPGTKMSAVNVNGSDDRGTVDMRFTSPGAPKALADYYSNAARENDFTEIASRADGDKMLVTAKKPDGDLMTIAITPAGSGSSGQIRITDTKK